jgi:hypothetical protein
MSLARTSVGGGAYKKRGLSEMEFRPAEGASMRLIVFEYVVIRAKFSVPANQVSHFPQWDFRTAKRLYVSEWRAIGRQGDTGNRSF